MVFCPELSDTTGSKKVKIIMSKVKPFLKWAGNKFHCLEQILSSFPSANRLIEPFTGSAAVFINTRYSSYLLAEANPDLVQLFRFIQKEGHSFIAYCQTFFSQSNNNEHCYYQYREQFNQSENPKLKAALFLYLNRHGYNGLCRYNAQGKYNVPFGRYDKPYFPRKEMEYFYQKSQAAEFIQNDFRKTFALAQPGDLIYCDPPYVPLSDSAKFSSYTKIKFTEQEHIELAKLALQATTKGITVMISNHDTEFTRRQYEKATIKSFLVNRFISCNVRQRHPVKEVLAIFTP
ncbi:DNA adenine methylase [Legionella israelensis]|uniref:Site-specific DNA-methyltransferase (adenine-specific) n=2 Tax=Legionella israelensis TaxID=454 RepID=A0A0W0WID7_9GAMM|nr:DNA adenine methylase [Legionella israelensis]SCY20965.1 DNA adenine methylase [Legionella israelensis DSM 19235]STX59835.1 DNA adenine methylase [Legionella israelensis]